jgi:hypothetical protein
MQNIIPPDEPQHNPSHTKRCTKCHLWLPFDKFCLSRKTKDGLFDWCKKCKSKQAKESLSAEQIRAKNMRRLHDVSLKEYDQMLADQDGVCYICKQSETAKSRVGKVKPLAIDHNHKTGENRMLLCQACNLVIGVIEENIDRLEMLLGYLEEMEQQEPVVKIIQLKLVD